MNSKAVKSKYNFSTKRYITHTWQGVHEFFTQYLSALPAIKAKTGTIPADAEITTLASTNNALDKASQLVDAAEAYLAAARDFRFALVTRKNDAKLSAPDPAPLLALATTLKNVPGGILWQEDGLTDRIQRSGKCDQADYELLGIIYHPATPVNPDTVIPKIFAIFDGGKVPLHWTLPRGFHLARLSCSVNHGDWRHLVTTDQASHTDTSPIPEKAEIRAYKLEIMDGDKPIGKPAIDKIIVGQDISVEESRL
jgi:hypothetical protein